MNSLRSRYVVITVAVSSYWIVSISLVFLNKYLLSSPKLKLDAPLFVTFYQCAVTVALCFISIKLSKNFPKLNVFSKINFDLKQLKKVLPLSIVFVSMITLNNLCLKHVGVSFYYVGRSLTTVFNVICSYIILEHNTSQKAKACCGLIIVGFFLGVDQEDAAGSLSIKGIIYGILASLCVALNAIYTKKTLPFVKDSIWELTLYNNINACILFVPLILFSGEYLTILNFNQIFSLSFWIMITLSGFFGFIMGYVTGWQIQVTSALTHNISGTAKAAFQTVMAVIIWTETKSFFWWISNIVVLVGSGLYTYFQKQDMDKKFYNLKKVVLKSINESNKIEKNEIEER